MEENVFNNIEDTDFETTSVTNCESANLLSFPKGKEETFLMNYITSKATSIALIKSAPNLKTEMLIDVIMFAAESKKLEKIFSSTTAEIRFA